MSGRQGRGEEGSALVMILFFVVSIGVLTAAILDFAGTGFRVAGRVAELRDGHHASESAVETAIGNIRGSNFVGRVGSEDLCSDDAPIYTHMPAPGSDDPTVEVYCRPEPLPNDPAADQPPFAVMALGTGASEGFVVSGNADLVVAGGVWSSSRVAENLSGPRHLQVIGDLVAAGQCTGSIFVTGVRECPATTYPEQGDPRYPAAVAFDDAAINAMVKDPAPSCASAEVVRFVPGLYSELPGVLLDASGLPCADAPYWWFSPAPGGLGVYYFDFPPGPSAVNRWNPTAEGASVIGGSPAPGWNPNTSPPPSVPGACDVDPTAPGVQFIFGGHSSLSNGSTNGVRKVDLCAGRAATTPQRIAVYGLCPTTVVGAPCEVDGRSSVGPEVVQATSASTGGQMTNGGGALAIGGGSATASLARGQGATVVVSGIGDIPEGSRITSAQLEVRHSSSTTANSLTVSARWHAANGAEIPCPLTKGTTTHTDTCDLTGALTSGQVGWRAFNGIQSVTYRADRDPGGGPGGGPPFTVSVDAIVLRVTYLLPGWEAHTCPTPAAAGQPPTCSLLADTGSNGTLSVHGTVYAPSASVRLNVHNRGETLFRRGVIARFIQANVSASSQQDDSPFQLDAGAASRRIVRFEARVDGIATLRTRVEYTDQPWPGDRVDVLDWVVLR